MTDSPSKGNPLRHVIPLLLAAALSTVACTPEQIETFNSLDNETQARVITALQHKPLDCYEAMRRTFPQSAWQRMSTIIHRESRNNPAAKNTRSSASGCTQLLKIHAPRFTRLGYSWERDRFDAVANLRVAHSLWVEAGWSPWRL